MNIEQKIRNNKEIMKNLSKFYSVEDLIEDAKNYALLLEKQISVGFYGLQ